MTTYFTMAYWCVLIAALLPIACAALAKSGQMTKPPNQGGYDNNNPRAWLAKQTGSAARANAAQSNSWEALPIFAAGVLSAEFLQVPQGRIDMMAMAFIACRVVYIGLYLGNIAPMRSVVWTAGLLLSLGLFFANMF